MKAASHALWLASEPFTLVLSAGFFGFFAHTGVLLALEERGLRPRRVIGASAGALAGGLWAAGVSAERLSRALIELRRQEFWDPGIPAGGLLRGHKFGALIRALLPAGVQRIEDCELTFAAVAHDLVRWRGVTIDRGPIEPAIRASCAVPLFFRPVEVGGRWLVDGGVSDRSGLSALLPGERCLYHHLPHRSPWPRIDTGGEGELQPQPQRRVFVCDSLPPVHPFALDRGPTALELARVRALAWLDSPA